MKKVALAIIVCLALIGGTLNAQGIDFKHISFDEALETAGQEDKLIFIDFYTSWCGPCKTMALSVFTNERIGDFYNRQFINIKLDAEKEGRDVARKYGVKAYPTLLFVNAKGEVIYKSVGSRDIASTLAMGKSAEESRSSEYSLVKLNELFPGKQDDERFLRIYIKKMIEYGQAPYEGIEAWLKIQTEIKEDDVDMMEFLMGHSTYLLVDGKAEEILKKNFDEYMDIATRKEEGILNNMMAKMAANTKKAAYEKKSPDLMRSYITNWKELQQKPIDPVELTNLEMDYLILNEDYEDYKIVAVNFVDSLIGSKSIEEIREADKKAYEEYKNTKYRPSLMSNIILENMAKGKTALEQQAVIERTGYYYAKFAESKKEYKKLFSWADYGDELVPGSYNMDNLRALAYKEKGDLKKAIEYKESALGKLPEGDKKRGRVERELAELKQSK